MPTPKLSDLKQQRFMVSHNSVPAWEFRQGVACRRQVAPLAGVPHLMALS